MRKLNALKTSTAPVVAALALCLLAAAISLHAANPQAGTQTVSYPSGSETVWQTSRVNRDP
jgi:hypothetical protein